jgi:hypothetical protein
MPRLVTRARVQVIVDVDVSDHWGADCPVAQVHKQAKESAVRAIKSDIATLKRLVVVGDPKVTIIFAEEDS